MRRSVRRAMPVVVAVLCFAGGARGADPLAIIPGAAGFGIETPAGSGRHIDVPKTRIIKVANLNTSGPGSLRAALEAEGPRVVIFEVSGNIDFSPLGGLQIRNPYVTVAGQTAPSPGITLKGCELGIRTHDVLLQHIRVRVGDLADPTRPLMTKGGWSQWSERDCMKISGERIVIDHCSFSWASDELVQSNASNVTYRHNLFGECLNSYKHHKIGHSKAFLIYGGHSRADGKRYSRKVDVVGNLFAHNADRCPAVSGAKIVIVNNLIYDVMHKPGVAVTLGDAPTDSQSGSLVASAIGNYFDKVPAAFMVRAFAAGRSEGGIYLGEQTVAYTPAEWQRMEGIATIALDEDQMPDYIGKPRDMSSLDRNGVVRDHVTDPWTAPHMYILKKWMGRDNDPLYVKREQPPIEVPGLRIRPSAEVREWVLKNAGARPADRDPVDARIVRQVSERTGRIIESQEDVAGWPELASNRHELTIPENPDGDDDGDGYTNLEEWLHAFADLVEGRTDTVPGYDPNTVKRDPAQDARPSHVATATRKRRFPPLTLYVAINGMRDRIPITANENQFGIVHHQEVAMYARFREAMEGNARTFEPVEVSDQWAQSRFTFVADKTGDVMMKLGAWWFNAEDEWRRVCFDDIRVTGVTLNNPSFEEEKDGSISGWGVEAERHKTLSAGDGGRNGGKCASLGFFDFARLTQTFEVEANKPVTVTFWYRTAPAEAGRRPGGE